MLYAIVPGDALDAYIDTHGDLGHAISRHESLDEARAEAESVAMGHHYGVEIVDESTWRVVDHEDDERPYQDAPAPEARVGAAGWCTACGQGWQADAQGRCRSCGAEDDADDE